MGWLPESFTPPRRLVGVGFSLELDESAVGEGLVYRVHDRGTGDEVGLVEVWPDPDVGFDAEVRSTVRGDLDEPLAEALPAWLEHHWPFTRVRHVGRDG
jgi:hypothetical protein